LTAWDAADDAGRDLFAVLGLPWGADDDAVRAAWRTTARRTHPDHGGDGEAFRAAQHARWVLSDETRRADYVLAHDHFGGSESGHATASDRGPAGGGQFADETDFFRGGWVDADDAEFFDDGRWDPTGASDGARDDAAFFDDEDADQRDSTTTAGGDDEYDDDDDGDPFAWDDDVFASGVGSGGFGLFDDFDPLDRNDSGVGARSTGRRPSRSRTPPGPRYRCVRCFRNALLGIDRCWSHASESELAAAIRLAGPGRCPVLNARNGPCGAPPLGLTAPFCSHHALGYLAPQGQGSGSPRRRAGRSPGGGARSATSGRTGTATRARGTTNRATTSARMTTSAQPTAATSGSAMAGCLTLIGFVGAIGAVLLLAGYLQEAVPGTSTISAVLQVLIGFWVLRVLVGRRSRRRRRRR